MPDPTSTERLRRRIVAARSFNGSYTYEYAEPDGSVGYDAEIDGRAADLIETLERALLNTLAMPSNELYTFVRSMLGDDAVDEWIGARNKELAGKLNDEEA